MNKLVNWPGHSLLALPVRLYLCYVFIFACLHKIAHPGLFAVDVATYGIVPLYLVNLMAITLPWVELAAGIMLLTGFRSCSAGLLVTLMMLMFIAALVIALEKGLDMSCGCFASQAANDEDPISVRTVLRDMGWLLLAIYVSVFDRNSLGIDRVLNRRRKINA
jgi:putative oxidoreductase